jgi:hypothetical protein
VNSLEAVSWLEVSDGVAEVVFVVAMGAGAAAFGCANSRYSASVRRGEAVSAVSLLVVAAADVVGAEFETAGFLASSVRMGAGFESVPSLEAKVASGAGAGATAALVWPSETYRGRSAGATSELGIGRVGEGEAWIVAADVAVQVDGVVSPAVIGAKKVASVGAVAGGVIAGAAAGTGSAFVTSATGVSGT